MAIFGGVFDKNGLLDPSPRPIFGAARRAAIFAPESGFRGLSSIGRQMGFAISRKMRRKRGIFLRKNRLGEEFLARSAVSDAKIAGDSLRNRDLTVFFWKNSIEVE